MEIFKTKKNTSDELIKKSAEVYNIFQDTANKLSELNVQIETERKAKQAEIQALVDVEKQLEVQATQNEKFANKINSFLND